MGYLTVLVSPYVLAQGPAIGRLPDGRVVVDLGHRHAAGRVVEGAPSQRSDPLHHADPGALRDLRSAAALPLAAILAAEAQTPPCRLDDSASEIRRKAEAVFST
ncbi:hypothetical protein [Rubellimicrobium sp. CFH 75288]|uniref:hypothetical protein n=1 Tax=Rubellimicrobium sp. CFH 75288 TaxID=2697034 RepID=UPI0014125765|nr:hypothetical protein [Rubellimicrobium sp. CFH 75288]NAZ35880.1 hypothetical protein [Rubellimicrobium sp. CFH 75288]